MEHSESLFSPSLSPSSPQQIEQQLMQEQPPQHVVLPPTTSYLFNQKLFSRTLLDTHPPTVQVKCLQPGCRYAPIPQPVRPPQSTGNLVKHYEHKHPAVRLRKQAPASGGGAGGGGGGGGGGRAKQRQPEPAYSTIDNPILSGDAELYARLTQTANEPGARMLIESFEIPIRSGRAWTVPKGSLIDVKHPFLYFLFNARRWDYFLGPGSIPVSLICKT